MTEYINDISKKVNFSISETVSYNLFKFLRKLSSFSVKSFSLLVLVFLGYCVFTSLIFMWLESNHREKSQEKFRQLLKETRSETIKKLCGELNITVCDEKIFNEAFYKYELFLKNYLDNFVYDMKPWPWNFYNSLGFMFVTFFTIGDGKMAPATVTGRILCCVTPLLGIPIVLMISIHCSKAVNHLLTGIYYRKLPKEIRETAKPSINYLMLPKCSLDLLPSESPGHIRIDLFNNNAAKFYKKPIKSEYNIAAKNVTDNEEIIENEPESILPPTENHENIRQHRNVMIPVKVAIVTFYGYVAIGALILALQMDWTFVSSFYYIHGMLTTIGFGDLDPWDKITILHFLYLFFGFTLAALAIEAVKEYLMENHNVVMKKISKSLNFLILNGEIVVIPHDLKINTDSI